MFRKRFIYKHKSRKDRVDKFRIIQNRHSIMSNVETKIFALKLAAKQITNSGKKLKKEETKEMEKCWKRVMRGELVVGRMHAENAVRNRNQSKDLLTLGARLQGAVNVLQTTKLQNKVRAYRHSDLFDFFLSLEKVDWFFFFLYAPDLFWQTRTKRAFKISSRLYTAANMFH